MFVRRLRCCVQKLSTLQLSEHNDHTQDLHCIKCSLAPAEIPVGTDLERLAGMSTYVISGAEARWQRTRQVP